MSGTGTVTVTPAKNADGSDGPVHPPMVLWRAVAPLIQELTSKYLYMDQKETEHLSFATARTLAIQGADYTGTAAQRRATQFALQDARRGGYQGIRGVEAAATGATRAVEEATPTGLPTARRRSPSSRTGAGAAGEGENGGEDTPAD